MHGVWTIALCTLILSGLAVPVFAACPPTFPPPDYHVMPDDDVQAFVTYSESDRIQTLVVQPTFSGTATEFGMVMPIPDMPEINEAPEDMFDELWVYTEYALPEVVFAEQSDPYMSADSSVVVLEQKAVGDFETTLLTAGDAGDLIDWLNSHDFQFATEDEANFDYYVQKGGYYFVAMKVNMDRVDVGDDGTIDGQLRPIEFVFKSEQPMLPFRIMAHDMDPMIFTLYTLGDIPYYIPGVEIIFADRIPDGSSPDIESLERYDPSDRWLFRMEVDFDPRAIEGNLILHRLHDADDWMQRLSPVVTINPHLSLPSSGIMPLFRLSVMDVEGFTNTAQAIENILSWYSECDDAAQIMLRADGSEPICVESDMDEYVDRGWVPIGHAAEVEEWKQDLAAVGILMASDFADNATPLKQASIGIPPESIECKETMQLMIRPGGGSACLTESSADALAERGWVKSAMMADELLRLS